MFASKVKKTLTILDDEGKEIPVNIRKLSRRALHAAAMARQEAVAALARTMGAEAIKAYQEGKAARQETEKTLDPAEARFQSYDVETVLAEGIESWGNPTPVKEGIADLDEDTADLIFREVIILSVPTKEEREALQGKS